MKAWVKERYIGDLGRDDDAQSALLYKGRQCVEPPTVSFCIPTFNRPDTLLQAIESVVGLDIALEHEIIVCDNSADLSSDNPSFQIARRFGSVPIRLYVNERNLGMTGNWNRLVELARGKYIAFLHDDDILAGSYGLLLRSLVGRVDAGELPRFGFLKVRFHEFREGGPLPVTRNGDDGIVRVEMRDSLISGIGPTATPTCGMLFSAEAIRSVRGFAEKYYPCADHVVGFAMQVSGYSGFVTKEKHAYYRWGLNETASIETQKNTYRKNSDIRAYIHGINQGYRLFGGLFESAQRYQNLVDVLSYCRTIDSNIDMSDIDPACTRPSGVRLMLLKAIRRVNGIDRRMRSPI